MEKEAQGLYPRQDVVSTRERKQPVPPHSSPQGPRVIAPPPHRRAHAIGMRFRDSEIRGKK